MKKNWLLWLFISLVLTAYQTRIIAQGPILDKPSDQLVRSYVHYNPIWTVEQQQRYRELTICSVYSRQLDRYWSHADDPAMHQDDIRFLYSLMALETVDWNPQTGFMINMGRAGLVVPRLEAFLWYADGSIRWVLVGQEDTIAGGRFALVFDTFQIDAAGAAHPVALYRVGE